MPTDVIMPALEMSQDTGLLVRWLKEEGDMVQRGEMLMEIETDKTVLEIESSGSGILANVTAAAGDEVPVGQVIAYLLADGESAADIAEPKRDVSTGGQDVQSKRESSVPSHPSQSVTSAPSAIGIQASPKARRLAKELGIEIAQVTGTGPEGVIQVSDVENHSGAPNFQSSYTVQPIKGTRKVVAERLQKSAQQAPHISLTLSVDMGSVREQLEQQPAIKLSSFLCQVIAATLVEHPRLNAHVANDEIRLFHEVHLGVAVALEDGLIVPVLRDVAKKDVNEIQSELVDLTQRARKRQLSSDETKGATFTLSNLGMYAIESFTSIVNPPEVAILSVGTIKDEPVAVDGNVEIRPCMLITINCDHRAVDGAVAAEFLRSLKTRLENGGA